MSSTHRKQDYRTQAYRRAAGACLRGQFLRNGGCLASPPTQTRVYLEGSWPKGLQTMLRQIKHANPPFMRNGIILFLAFSFPPSRQRSQTLTPSPLLSLALSLSTSRISSLAGRDMHIHILAPSGPDLALISSEQGPPNPERIRAEASAQLDG